MRIIHLSDTPDAHNSVEIFLSLGTKVLADHQSIANTKVEMTDVLWRLFLDYYPRYCLQGDIVISPSSLRNRLISVRDSIRRKLGLKPKYAPMTVKIVSYAPSDEQINDLRNDMRQQLAIPFMGFWLPVVITLNHDRRN